MWAVYEDCKAGSMSTKSAAWLVSELQYVAALVICLATGNAAATGSKHFACCRQELQAAKASAKAEKAMHEPPRLGKVKFEAEPVQVMMTSSALLEPEAPVMLSVPTADPVPPLAFFDASSMCKCTAACTRLQWIAKITTALSFPL